MICLYLFVSPLLAHGISLNAGTWGKLCGLIMYMEQAKAISGKLEEGCEYLFANVGKSLLTAQYFCLCNDSSGLEL